MICEEGHIILFCLVSQARHIWLLHKDPPRHPLAMFTRYQVISIVAQNDFKPTCSQSPAFCRHPRPVPAKCYKHVPVIHLRHNWSNSPRHLVLERTTMPYWRHLPMQELRHSEKLWKLLCWRNRRNRMHRIHSGRQEALVFAISSSNLQTDVECVRCWTQVACWVWREWNWKHDYLRTTGLQITSIWRSRSPWTPPRKSSARSLSGRY